MAKLKATHKGTCQCCGNFQKLPNGVLSNHGYTKQWGFFSGTCNGAGYPPFEESCNYIESCIKDAKKSIEANNAKIQDLLSSTGPQCRAYVYLSYSESPSGKSGYFWVQGTVENGHLITDSKKQGINLNNRGHGLTDTAIIKNLNLAEVKHIERRSKQLEQYIKWQTDRVASWEPKPLTPVEK